MVSNGMTIHFFYNRLLNCYNGNHIFKDHNIIFARSAIYPLFPYKYLLFPTHSIFIVSGNSYAIIKENLKCDKCFL